MCQETRARVLTNRRPLRFDPQRWQFVDDDQANGWLDYDRRDPWQLPSV